MTSPQLLACSIFCAALAGVSGCFFPDYTFDNAGGAGTGSSVSSSKSSSTDASSSSGLNGTTTGATTNASSGATGGAGGATSSSTGVVGTCDTVDCSNPACKVDYSCVAMIPAGWTGYFALFDGKPGTDPGCPTTYPNTKYNGNGGIDGEPATCSMCKCTNLVGEKCALSTTIDVIDSACAATPNCGATFDVPSPWDGSCYGPDGLPGGTKTCGAGAGADCTMGTAACNVSVETGPLAVSPGSCTANTQMPSVPGITWASAADACGDPDTSITTGCGAGFTCMAKPPQAADYESGVCIMQTGDVACPAGAFIDKHVFFGSDTDNRTCSACGCDPSSGATCSGTVTVYSAPTVNTCTGLVATLNVSTAAGACIALTGNNPATGSRKATFTAPSGGMCGTNGGTPIGAAVAINPTTFCCVP